MTIADLKVQKTIEEVSKSKSDNFIKSWIKNDPPQGNNKLHFSTPTNEKKIAQQAYRHKVEIHFLRKLADKLYLKIIL